MRMILIIIMMIIIITGIVIVIVIMLKTIVSTQLFKSVSSDRKTLLPKCSSTLRTVGEFYVLLSRNVCNYLLGNISFSRFDSNLSFTIS